MKKILTMTLEEIYYDWANDFLTIDGMAEHYGIDTDDMERIVEAVRNIYSRPERV